MKPSESLAADRQKQRLCLKQRKENNPVIVMWETDDRILLSPEDEEGNPMVLNSFDEDQLYDPKNRFGTTKSRSTTPQLIRETFQGEAEMLGSNPPLKIWNREKQKAEPYESAYLDEILAK